MPEAMASAPVGDDQRGEDPSVNALQDFAAELLGKEAALFLPSATMANQIALKIHTQPGDEVICHERAHIRLYEGGGPAVLSGCLLHLLPSETGLFTAEQVHHAVNPDDQHFARTRLVCIENTHNACGGLVASPEQMRSACDAARENNLALHLDGSRLMNAAVSLNRPASDLTAPFDTVTLCLSKGLGAPVGAVLAGSRVQMHEAKRWQHVFGGAMRQSGIIAAGGLFALQNHVSRLCEDHGNAARLAEGLAHIPGIMLSPPPQTNIVFFDISGTVLSGETAKAKLETEGVRASGGGHRLRFVTHLDVSRAQVDEAIAACHRAFS